MLDVLIGCPLLAMKQGQKGHRKVKFFNIVITFDIEMLDVLIGCPLLAMKQGQKGHTKVKFFNIVITFDIEMLERSNYS